MQYRLKHTLGLTDARACNDLGESLSIDITKLTAGCVIELSDKGYTYLTCSKRGKGYAGLLEPAEPAKVKAVAKDPAIGASK